MNHMLQKTLEYFGFVDETAATISPAPQVLQNQNVSSWRSKNSKLTQIATYEVDKYDDILKTLDSVLVDIPVILKLNPEMPTDEARRVVDFCLGLSFGVRGKLKRVTKNVFILAPQSVNLDGTAEDEQQSTVDAAEQKKAA